MDETTVHVHALMVAAHVTDVEAKAFMGEVLCRAERDRMGAASDFLKELIRRRRARP